MLAKISQQYDALSKSERKVAGVILKNPQRAILSSITRLATDAAVSEPTVNRFCHTMGCKGFPDFKLKLAQSLASGTPYVSPNIDINDTVEQLSEKVFSATLSSLTEARDSLDTKAIKLSIRALSKATRIEFYGSGSSGRVVLDAQHKFMRLNIPIVSHTDAMMQHMAAAATEKGVVVLIVSYTGRTISIIEAAQYAKNAGAMVIGMTLPNSQLAKHCDIVIPTRTAENTDIYTPMITRIVQLTLLDILATGVILAKGPDFIEHLRRIKENVLKTRYPTDTDL